MKKERIIFLDFDGVLTSVESGTHYALMDDLSYKPSKKLVDRVKKLCEETDAKIVISSNWRKYEDNGRFNYRGILFPNQLPKIRKTLKKYIIGYIPSIRGLSKAKCVLLWLEDNPKFKGKFVILDDADYEEFAETTDHKISKSFIKVDPVVGFSEKDYEKAKKRLT